MTNQNIILKKCIIVSLPQHTFILPFKGNFTEQKKEVFAEKIQHCIIKHQLNCENVTSIFCDIFGVVKNNITISQPLQDKTVIKLDSSINAYYID